MNTKTSKKTTRSKPAPVRDEPTENVCRHGSRPVDERCDICWREENGEPCCELCGLESCPGAEGDPCEHGH